MHVTIEVFLRSGGSAAQLGEVASRCGRGIAHRTATVRDALFHERCVDASSTRRLSQSSDRTWAASIGLAPRNQPTSMGIPASCASGDPDASRTVRVLRIGNRDGASTAREGSLNAKFPTKRTTNFN